MFLIIHDLRKKSHKKSPEGHIKIVTAVNLPGFLCVVMPSVVAPEQHYYAPNSAQCDDSIDDGGGNGGRAENRRDQVIAKDPDKAPV